MTDLAPTTLQYTQCSGSCNNYSGYFATNYNYTGAYANMTIPNLSAACGHDGELSNWVGIVGNRALVQAGVVAYEIVGSVYFSPFYEWVGPATTNPITNSWVPTTGDRMYYRVEAPTASHGVNFLVQDLSNGLQHTITMGGGPWNDYSADHDVATFITENHEADLPAGSNANPLHDTFNWTNAVAQQNSGPKYGLSTQNPVQATGANRQNNVLVEAPGGFTSTTSFSDYWQAC